MTEATSFKLTYSTMFNPPEELHTRFDEALKDWRSRLGQEYSMIIDGKDVFADEKFDSCNPARTSEVLAVFQKGTAGDAERARGVRRDPADRALGGFMHPE